jgi:hypothetical protein
VVAKERLEKIKGIDEVKHLGGNSWQLVSKASNDVRKEVFDFAVSNKLGVLTLSKEEQRMEDVFKELTKK